MSLIRQPDVTAWYKEASDASVILREAYNEAATYFEQELSNNEEQCKWIRANHSIQDVLALAIAAEAQYAQGSGSGHRQEARKWCNRFCQNVMYYGKIFDMLAQHHPEYVALAWGATKFVLQGILNHAELVSEFTKAMSQIADVLPRIELNSQLYPTKAMKHIIARIYAHVMLFTRQMVKWYTMGSLRRSCSSIIKPWALNYAETCKQIQSLTLLIDAAAEAASRAELRDITISLQDHDRKLEVLHSNVEQLLKVAKQRGNEFIQLLQCAHNNYALGETISSKLDDQSLRLCDIQFSQILNILRPERTPEDVLYTCQSIAKRRKLQTFLTSVEHHDFVGKLNEWISSPRPVLFTIHPGSRAESKAKDLAVEVVILLKRISMSEVIWFLSERLVEGKHVELVDVLKFLVFQLLSRDTEIVRSEPSLLNIAQFHTAHSEVEWVDLLVHLVARSPRCFMVVETESFHQRFRQDRIWCARVLEVLNGMIDKVEAKGGLLKILFIGQGSSGVAQPHQTGAGKQLTAFLRSNQVPLAIARRTAAKNRGGFSHGSRIAKNKELSTIH